MILHRRAAALIVTILMLLPAAPAAFAGTPPSPLTPTAPTWLKPAAAPAVGATQTSTTAQPAPATQLPRTGFDLLPEVIAGAVLIGAGLSLRAAVRTRRA